MLGALLLRHAALRRLVIYGFTGTVSFPRIVSALNDQAGAGIVLGIVFVAAGVCFKMSAVPFHMWTPDVYEARRRLRPPSSPPREDGGGLHDRAVFIGALPT